MEIHCLFDFCLVCIDFVVKEFRKRVPVKKCTFIFRDEGCFPDIQ